MSIYIIVRPFNGTLVVASTSKDWNTYGASDNLIFGSKDEATTFMAEYIWQDDACITTYPHHTPVRYSLPMVQPISSPETISRIMSAYYPTLHRIATSRLRHTSTSVMDADDAVSSAFLSFWQGCSDGRFTITTDTDVYYILNMLMSRQCTIIVRYHRSLRRSTLITESMDDATADGIMGTDPDPSSTMCAADMLSYCLSRLDDIDRQILTYRLEGWDHAETAKLLGLCAKTVSRRMLSIKTLVHQMQ